MILVQMSASAAASLSVCSGFPTEIRMQPARLAGEE